MKANEVTDEIRRELQHLLSEERDLVNRAEHATVGGDYLRLRDLADELIKMSERRTTLRASLIAARAEVGAAQDPARRPVDQSAETWRLLR